MKIIITENQLRLIVEDQKKDNLYNFTSYSDSLPPHKWDKIYSEINEDEGGEYDGYYINGNVDIRDSKIKEFKHLVIINGSLLGRGSKIENLGKLRTVYGKVDFSKTENLKSLDNLKEVLTYLDLYDSKIESLGSLKYVGKSLDLRYTKKLTSLDEVIKVDAYVTTYDTGLSDKDIDEKIKVFSSQRIIKTDN